MQGRIIDWAGDIGNSYRGLKIIESFKSKHQSVSFVKSKNLGGMLILNGEVQYTDASEFLYHEPLVHLPMSFVKKPRKVLIIGGGCLGAVREVLKYKTIETVKLVEIDPDVLQLIRRRKPDAQKIVRDSRLEIIQTDGYKFISKSHEKFDIILNDAVDITRIKSKKNFVEVCNERLQEGGVGADVVYRSIFEKKTTSRMLIALKRIPHVAFSLIVVPEYPGSLHLLAMWGKNNQIKQDQRVPINIEQLLWRKNKNPPCKYFDPSFLDYFLYLPKYVRNQIKFDVSRK